MRTVTVAGATLALGGLLLAGCAQPAPEGQPGIEGEPDTETTTADAPSALLGTGCDELIELAVVQDALGTVESGTDSRRIPGGSWPLSHVGLAQSGVLDCYWSDDAAPQEKYSSYLSVLVLPNAAAAWANQESELNSWSKPFADHGDAAFANCAGSGDYLYCEYDVLVGTSWLHAEVKNLDAHDDAAPVIRALTDSVAAAEPVEPVWAPTGSLPASCAQWLTAEEISAAVGTDGIAERNFPLMMPIILNGALDGSLACSWSNSYSSAQAMPIQVAALPGAEWAWDTAWAKPRPERSPAAPLDGVGEQAFAGCATDQNVCFVDVLSGGTWITVDGNKQAGIDGLQRIAEAAVAGLTA